MAGPVGSSPRAAITLSTTPDRFRTAMVYLRRSFPDAGIVYDAKAREYRLSVDADEVERHYVRPGVRQLITRVRGIRIQGTLVERFATGDVAVGLSYMLRHLRVVEQDLEEVQAKL